MQRVVSSSDSLSLAKYQALGNDYLVVDDPAAFESAIGAVVDLCDRHLGVGADGLLLLDPGPGRLRIINPDGSEAEKSGNGLRIAAAHLVLEHGREGSFALEVPAGAVRVRVLEVNGPRVVTEIDLGVARVGARERISPPGVEAVAVDLGNPHCVVFGEPVSAQRCLELGPLLETHSRFPKRTNVQLAEAPDRATVHIEIWERGAGYTLASGTSAGAAAAACMEAGIVDSEVRVVMPGGSLRVSRQPDGRLLQTGPAHRVFRGQVDLP